MEERERRVVGRGKDGTNKMKEKNTTAWYRSEYTCKLYPLNTNGVGWSGWDGCEWNARMTLCEG